MNMRVVFMGTPDFAGKILEKLIEDKYEVVGVVTAPDRPKGRGGHVQKSEVKILAEKYNLTIFQPEKIRRKESVEYLYELKPDLIIVAAYGQIIPKSILELPKHGCINVHGSLLPKYRGASPIHYALLNGENETGITIMLMDEGMDTGPMLSKKIVPIEQDDNLSTLHDKLAEAGAELLVATLPKYLSGEIKPQAQNNDEATYTKILQKSDGKIDWEQSADSIFNMVRAFNPWPGTFSLLDNKMFKILKVNKYNSADLIDNVRLGELRVINGKLLVGTRDGVLEIVSCQIEGKKAVSGIDFVNGYHDCDHKILI